MAAPKHDLWSLTPFERWVQEEGLPVITQQYIYDLHEVELAPWKRTGCLGAILDIEAEPIEGAFVNRALTISYMFEIPPGGVFKAERHIYEELIYVLSGEGAATIWNDGTKKHTFEWQTGSLFSPPLNAWHEFYNGRSEPARMVVFSNAPQVFKLYRNREFIFNNPYIFAERFSGKETDYFDPKGKKVETRYLETNFVPDLRTIPLDTWTDRGPGANMMFLMADNSLMAHVSEFPVGSYKKAHSHHIQMRAGGGTALILMLSSKGYDVQWPVGEIEKRETIPWKEGTFCTAGYGYHQHFNTGPVPARYLAFRTGNPRYSGAMATKYKRTGGEQIEYEQEDPLIRAQFLEELKKEGIPVAAELNSSTARR
jgi:hypothetical protein